MTSGSDIADSASKKDNFETVHKEDDRPEPPSENAPVEVEIPKEDHSIWKLWQKRCIVMTSSFATLLSPLASNVYFPALNVLAHDLHVTDSQINLSVTTYLIFQGVSPTIIASFSDDAGRRPALLICFIIFLAANVGLALQNSYAALMVLRCLQSAGSSPTVALMNGVMSDIATSAERGSFIGYASVSMVLGPSLSPIIGGLLSQYLGWRSIFWFLVIFSAVIFAVILPFFPETCHKIAGNGSILPRGFFHKSITAVYYHKKRIRSQTDKPEDSASNSQTTTKIDFRSLNPFRSLKLIADKEAALILFFNGLLLAVHYLVLTTIPSQYASTYGFNELQISLVYIPYGGGSIVAAFTTGKLMDWNYRRHARRLNFPVSKNKLVDLGEYPIERARLEIAMPQIAISSSLLIVYGWLLDIEVQLGGPLVLLFFLGYSLVSVFQVTQVLLIDNFPKQAAAATVSGDLMILGVIV